jgi:hypothetical protein
MLRTIKKKREREKRETSGARMTAVRLCVSSSSASHEIRLIIRLYTHPIFWGGMRSAALVFYVYVYAALIYFQENKFQTKLKAAIIILLFSKKKK